MFDSLTKNGLSDTKHSLKFHIGNCSANKNGSASRSSQPRPPSHKKAQPLHISHFQLDSAPPYSHPKTTIVLEQLIQIIATSSKESCTLKGHDRNTKKIICLEPNCREGRQGCSYCFLEGHQGHVKIDGKNALEDLSEIEQLVRLTRARTRMSLLIRKEETLSRLAATLKQIRQTFTSELQYLQKKIYQSIQQQYQQKLRQLSSCLQPKNIDVVQLDQSNWTFPASSYKSFSSDCKLQDKVVVQNIFDLFGPQENVQFKKTASNGPKAKVAEDLPLQQNYYKSAKVGKEVQERLLQKLVRLNRGQVQEYLKEESIEVHEVEGYLKVYSQFYRELKQGLEELFRMFKCAVPGYRSIERCMEEPEILRNIENL